MRKAARLLVTAMMGAGVAAAAADPSVPPKAASPSHIGAAVEPVPGRASGTVLAPEWKATAVARGAMPLENGSPLFKLYGYAEDHPRLTAPPGLAIWPGRLVEKTKTEPDKNVYLVLDGQKGADAAYDYGRHFLFQGHESGPRRWRVGGKQGLVTRINLDADEPHRITLLAETDTAGKPLPAFDGITWHPFSQRLLLTAEAGSSGGVWQATLDVPSKAEDISGALGRGGYEGIQSDSDGNLWIVEDVSEPRLLRGAMKQPQGFLYRFVPKDKSDLTKGGRLQALQVIGGNGKPVTYSSEADVLGPEIAALHSYGVRRTTRWVTIHDTDKDGSKPFDANSAARVHQATPFKRPENGVFRPGTDFREFYFSETGDSNTGSPANARHGGYGGILVVRQASPSADEGEIALVLAGDREHNGFDNVTFWSADELMVAEDAGDSMHAQRKALDSAWLLDLRVDYGARDAPRPKRVIAQGRDAAAAVDSGYVGKLGFNNDGDNEITGIHVSDGDPTPAGLLGAKVPSPFRDGWRVFYTQQHGDNVTFELLPAAAP